ncbi:MAG: hypothetical protein IJX12_04190 [Lachnospiraceae bacterium]|nr:hypothetical protein [Lachnospiraceae bacterium]
MKKIIVTFILLFLICFCSGCEFGDMMLGQVDFSENPEKVSVVVNGVDNGYLHCKYVCEYGESYAYYDQDTVYYYQDENRQPYEIQCFGLNYMAMNEDYIYLAQNSTLSVFNKETMELSEVEDVINVKSIIISGNEVLVYNGEYGDYTFYELEGDKIVKETLIEDGTIYKTENNLCENTYGYEHAYFFYDDKMYRLEGQGYRLIDKKGEKGEFNEYFHTNEYPETSPEHMCYYEGKLYILLQSVKNPHWMELNSTYNRRDWDMLICYDPEIDSTEIIYETSGKEEQIACFSIENDELYLMKDGILCRSTLQGDNCVEIADYVGVEPVLYFDYGNDTLYVYYDARLLGRYNGLSTPLQ